MSYDEFAWGCFMDINCVDMFTGNFRLGLSTRSYFMGKKIWTYFPDINFLDIFPDINFLDINFLRNSWTLFHGHSLRGHVHREIWPRAQYPVLLHGKKKSDLYPGHKFFGHFPGHKFFGHKFCT